MNDRAIQPVRPGGAVGTALGQLPPEAITKAVEVVGTILTGAMELTQERQRFQNEMERLRNADLTVEARITGLTRLVEMANLSDASRDKIVDTICQLALR